MENNTIYLIIIIFVIIFLAKLLSIRKLEHLTQSSDEAIQNLASLYNKDQLTIGTIKANKLQLGDKWLISSDGDFASNDGWVRLMKADGKNYATGFAADSLWTANGAINGRAIFSELDSLKGSVGNLQAQINSLQGQINQRVVIGGRYGFHRGHDNSVIWGHGVILQPCGLGGCPGCPNNCTAG